MRLKGAKLGLVKGLASGFREEGIIALQYADDTILFTDVEESHLVNLKSILLWFEQISGMRVNFHKSEIIPMNLSDLEAHDLSHFFSCPLGEFPIKYLGIPLHYDNLRREDIQPLVDKMLKKIAGWRGKLLSYAARLVLIKACLASIPVYLLSFIKFLKWAIRIIHTHMANFLWNDNPEAHRYHLINWDTVSLLKEFGGLGVPNLRDLNICLLASWVKRYSLDENKLWKQVIDHKYSTDRPNIFYSNTTGSSSFFQRYDLGCQGSKDGLQMAYWQW